MARKNKTDTAPAEAAHDGGLATLILSHGDKSVRYADLPEKSQVRMALKAFNELMNDSTAFSKEQIEKIKAKAIDDGAQDEGEQAVADAKAEKRDARFNALLSGEFSVGARGPRGSKIETLIRAVAVEGVKALWLASPKTIGPGGKRLPLPKGDALQTLLDRYMGKHGDAVKAEAQRRAAGPVEGSVGDIDLD